jgi:hypothetical protein
MLQQAITAVPKDHPRLLATPEELPELRKRIRPRRPISSVDAATGNLGKRYSLDYGKGR